MRSNTKVIFQFLLVIFVSSSIFVRAQTKVLDGKTFEIQLTKTKGKRTGWQWTTDEISFDAKKMKAKEMFKHERFPGAVYKVTIDSSSTGKTINFVCDMFNPDISQIQWQGKIKNDKIDGTAIWFNGQGKQMYTFSGSLK